VDERERPERDDHHPDRERRVGALCHPTNGTTDRHAPDLQTTPHKR
jgi:hypothetical protein